MKLHDLHEKLSHDEEYRRSYAEEDLIARAAIHVLRCRNESGLTQEDLASMLGKRQTWVSRVEAGQENLTLRTIAQLAYALERDPVELVAPVEDRSAVTT